MTPGISTGSPTDPTRAPIVYANPPPQQRPDEAEAKAPPERDSGYGAKPAKPKIQGDTERVWEAAEKHSLEYQRRYGGGPDES
jgi:hypothetical protein